jgi:type IV pilus assembly protein PilA
MRRGEKIRGMAMSDAVYLGRNGQQLGPYTRAQLAAMAQRGEIMAGDLAWYDGLLGWREAEAVLKGLGIVPGPANPPPLPAGLPQDIAAPKAAMSRRDEYEAFIGPEKSGYYVPVFEHFDAGRGSAWWNWPAALVAQYWMLYRGMYLWGFLWYPILVWISAGVVSAVLQALLGPAGALLAFLIILFGPIVVMGLYANKIFHGHVLKLIRRSLNLGLSEPLRREWLIRKGATSMLWVLIVLVFGGVAVIGILAAIAIPAYQDYTIRAQVSEGAVLADPAKTAVAQYYLSHNSYPADNAAAGLTGLHGQYAQQVQVENGTIEIIYGGSANPLIKGKVLAYVPEDAGRGRLQWRCNTEQTTVLDKWLPPVCRK